MPVVPGLVSKRSDKKDIISPKDILGEAISYFQATLLLEEQRKKDDLFPPVLMNATFACELYSKAILLRENQSKDLKQIGHNLKKLYDSFSEQTKTELKKILKEERFETFIEEIAELFEFWRYRYEYSSYSTHYSFVINYMKALNKIANNEITNLRL